MKSNIVLKVKDTDIQNLVILVEKLEGLGMSIDNTFEFGVIIGTMEASDVDGLRDLEEIDSFTVNAQIDLPPSDANIQ
ncbi:hypothetical protein [uncultured Chryseobacterium sp.]|uniref:hypothetical protein n=1 Tax=uncultured Chryseobacterium sp. TaxID=259322 RepID=UPI002585E773|nr:hypothetical protein [uncultured Chryseobacterium sp.]